MSEVIFSVFPSENFIDLGLYQFGWEKCDPSHSFGPAARNHYLFHYCISGTGILYSNNTKGEWLFPILFELERATDLSGYSKEEARIYGYLSEILLNVWVKKNNLKVKYISIVNSEFSVNQHIENIYLKLMRAVKNILRKHKLLK